MRQWMMTALSAILVTLGFAACASSPPSELREARASYRQAAHGPAAVEAPRALADARTALREAEAAFDEHGNAPTTRIKAREARRKAQRAIDLAERRIEAKNERPKEVVQPVRPKPDKAHPVVQAEAERTDALDALRQFATVSEGERGLSISMAADIAFESGSAVVSPMARGKLELIAAVLQQHSESDIRIIGYADATGDETSNRKLSLERAGAVRDAFVALGLPANRFTVFGRGEDLPVASNDTPEGRAQNRRVEIQIGATDKPEAQEKPAPAPKSPFDILPPGAPPAKPSGEPTPAPSPY